MDTIEDLGRRAAAAALAAAAETADPDDGLRRIRDGSDCGSIWGAFNSRWTPWPSTTASW